MTQQHLQKNIQACNNQQKSIFEGAEPRQAVRRGEGVSSKQGEGQGGKEREKDGSRKKINIEAGPPPICPLKSAQWEARTAAMEKTEEGHDQINGGATNRATRAVLAPPSWMQARYWQKQDKRWDLTVTTALSQKEASNSKSYGPYPLICILQGRLWEMHPLVVVVVVICHRAKVPSSRGNNHAPQTTTLRAHPSSCRQ